MRLIRKEQGIRPGPKNMAVSISWSELALQSCEQCRLRKKKCDRIYSTCTPCKEKLLKCAYEEPAQAELKRLRAQVHELTFLAHNQCLLLHGATLRFWNTESPAKYPIPSRWYIPMLLEHYQEMINPPLFRPDHNKNTLSPNSWIQESLSDPCMFNAVLLAASSHLDFIRRETDNPITQYHYRSTLRLLSHSISRGGQLSHALIAATVHLWHYESMNPYAEGAEIHKSGLQEMVRAAGGLPNLGMDGFLAHLVTLIDIGHAIVTASCPSFANITPVPLPLPLITLLSPVLKVYENNADARPISRPLLGLLQDLHQTIIRFEVQLLSTRHEGVIPRLEISPNLLDGFFDDRDSIVTNSTMEKYLSLACVYAAKIHLNSLAAACPFSSNNNQKLVNRLMESLSQLNSRVPQVVDPATFIWLCFTGAAAAQRGKTWFLAIVGPVVMSLRGEELELVKCGLLRFYWLLQHLQNIDI